MTQQLPKRLIEVDLPIKRISAHARREKSIRHGHISTLHIWWARRPLAACRAVTCAALWPDPVDENCPAEFRAVAAELMFRWATDNAARGSAESAPTFTTIRQHTSAFALCNHLTTLRLVLLDFIADFANWDNSTVPEYLETARALTAASHWALNLPVPRNRRFLGWPGAERWHEQVRQFQQEAGAHPRPLVVDPFAGGGSIPLEALRVGADSFASDLNPLPVLLNKVTLEYIPKYGKRLADEVRKWGERIKREAEAELKSLYPHDPDGALPLAYLWARTIKCEGPGCGAEVPLIRSLWLAKRANRPVGLQLVPNPGSKRVDFSIVCKKTNGWFHQGTNRAHVEKPNFDGTVRRSSATCPCCGYTTPADHVRAQFKGRRGGASDARLTAVVTIGGEQDGRSYRAASSTDDIAYKKAGELLRSRIKHSQIDPLPDEPLPYLRSIFNIHLLDVNEWGDLFNHRQGASLVVFQRIIREHGKGMLSEDKEFGSALITCLALAIGRQANSLTSLCRWNIVGEKIEGTFARQALGIVWDYCEANPFSGATGGVESAFEWVAKVCEENERSLFPLGSSNQASATNHPLPDDSAQLLFTDPPYYDAVPYADLSDFFYVWLKRMLVDVHVDLFRDLLTPKEDEVVQLAERNQAYAYKTKERFEELMTKSLAEGRRVVDRKGIGCIVFAHKSTDAWEVQLQSLIEAGWIVTASWPIDTEMGSRLRAMNSAALASSVHLICRPRENIHGQISLDEIGDWRDVLNELPKRIHEWMPRLASEGVVGADAIFACLGPALEIFSRYSRVEKASGEQVTLREYLEHIWAAVSKEALSSLITGSDLSTLEADARISAMWLWTLNSGASGADGGVDGDGEDSADDEEGGVKAAAKGGFGLEYDAARKIAQGLGASLEDMKSVVEVNGDQARLLPVAERTAYLFGKDQASTPDQAGRGKKKKAAQMDLFAELCGAEVTEAEAVWEEKTVSKPGATVLDRVHQSMILFATGRGEGLKRFLVEDGIGREGNFWKLAQALSALYPSGSQEKRWVDGVLARKKGLGL
jgi:putative DNA methylase